SAGVRRGVDLASVLMLHDETLAEYEQRMEAMRKLLRFAFYEGASPGLVVRRVFCLAKWRQVHSSVLLDKTLQQLGTMFGETRAAWSWRVKHVINRFLEHRRVRGNFGSFQKS